jgi:glutaconyl-CoA decarboxylase
MMLTVLRKGSAAAHYVMGGPTANNHTAFTLGTATTEIYVMHGETAATASFARRLVKEKDAGKSLQPVLDKMNQLAKEYYNNSRPVTVPSRVWWTKSFVTKTSANTWSHLPMQCIRIRNPSARSIT